MCYGALIIRHFRPFYCTQVTNTLTEYEDYCVTRLWFGFSAGMSRKQEIGHTHEWHFRK
jgi:hypothetical protein